MFRGFIYSSQGFFQGGGGGGWEGHLPPFGFGLPPPPLGYAEISVLHVNLFKCLYKSFNDRIKGELCLCKKSPRLHQIASNKRS